MKRVVWLVSSLSLSLLGGISAQNEASAWREFNLAFGEEKMASCIGTVDQLSLAVQHEVEVSSSFPEEDIAKFACASYQDGTDISAWARARESHCDQTWISPLLVSQEEDLLCFIIRSPDHDQIAPEIVSKLSFLVSIPAQLKVESNVLNMIEMFSQDDTTIGSIMSSFFGPERGDDNLEIDLSISYYSNATTIYSASAGDSPDLVDEENGHRAFLRKANLLSYSTSSLKNFYWSESSTSNQQFNNSVSKNIHRWEDFSETFDVQSVSSSNEDSDLCNFKNLEVNGFEGDITIPLDSFISSCQLKEAGACLAFLVSEFASDPKVSLISLTSRASLFNYRARSIQQFGMIGKGESKNPFTAAGLTGINQVVGIADTGLDDRSCYFIDPSQKDDIERGLISKPFTDFSRRKVVQYSRLKQTDTEDLTAGHGTHVAGTVAGYNQLPLAGDGLYSGVAPLAKIAFFDIATESGSLYIPPVSQHYNGLKKANARVCSNSWGGSFSKKGGYYANGNMDEYLYKNMKTLVLFANGNSGAKGLGSVSREASGKNVVSVGMGPTYDNRIKPDIVAPGAGLVSARASVQNSNDKTCETTFKQGTSMATPAAAGAAALLRQYFEDTEGKFWVKTCAPASDKFCTPFTPSGVLLKALLLHSGQPMTMYHEGDKSKDVDLSEGKYGQPDFYQGYGRVQLSNVIPLPGKSSFQLTVRDMVEIAEKSSAVHHFKVTDSSKPLVVTLSWYDPPASSTAAKALVNDLDLILKRPNGKRKLFGNMKKNRDDINTNERIYIQNPDVGKYIVVVKANALPVAGRQPFALVLSYTGTPIAVEEYSHSNDDDDDDDDESGVEMEQSIESSPKFPQDRSLLRKFWLHVTNALGF